MSKRKLIVIGLEAAEISLINQWKNQGFLPHLSRLMDTGSYCRLWSCTEVSSGATWASVNTGTNPGKHGMAFYHRQIQSGTYDIIKKYAEAVAAEPFWIPLAESGHKTAVLDIPETYPAKQYLGDIMVGWGAEGLNYKQCSKPRSLIRDVKKRFGPHPLQGWYQRRPTTPEKWRDFAEVLVKAARQRSRLYEWLLEKKDYDLFYVGYAELHWVGHFFWFLQDPAHPDYDIKIASLAPDAIRRVYESVDAGIGRLLHKYPDSDFLIFSNTGMGANYSGLHLVQDILDAAGLGYSKSSQAKKSEKSFHLHPQRTWGAYTIKQMESLVGPENIQRVKGLFPERFWDAVTRRLLNRGHGWEECKVFVVPSDYSCTIRVNLKGREPHGIISPGEEYRATCESIREIMMNMTNPATGECPVEEIVFTHDRYAGDHLDDLPDVIIRWKGDAPIRELRSDGLGSFTGDLPDKRTGAHYPYGFMIASGPHFRAAGSLPEGNINDLAPTIFHYFQQPVPEHIDGVFKKEIFVNGIS